MAPKMQLCACISAGCGHAVTGLYMMSPIYKTHARNDKQLALSGAPPSATASQGRDSTREQQEEQILAETLFHPGPMDALVSTPYNDAPHVHKPPGVQRDPTLQSDCSNKLTDREAEWEPPICRMSNLMQSQRFPSHMQSSIT
ncbi:hypothetical protein EDC04DRAFT_2604765 [Pisolithus marmoratus]|nr:hypothetical protein EDC04DRAFT_2604765 [Pisolithus marmoratus]